MLTHHFARMQELEEKFQQLKDNYNFSKDNNLKAMMAMDLKLLEEATPKYDSYKQEILDYANQYNFEKGIYFATQISGAYLGLIYGDQTLYEYGKSWYDFLLGTEKVEIAE